MADGTLKLAVSAPPENGRANAAVVELLAEVLGLRARQLKLVRGAGSRTKVIAVDGLEASEVMRRLEAALARSTGGKGRDGE